jgi:hypothetical protein
MPTYDGIGTSITHNVEVDGNLFLQDIEGGPDSTRVPLEIFSNLVSSSVESANSRMLRLRVQNYGETNTDNSYVTDMGIRGDPGKDYFFITAPQNTSNVGDQNTFVISSTSNVGIGTTDPTKPLHVVGGTGFTGTLTASNIIGASPVTISSNLVMASGFTLTAGAIEPPAGAESNLKITGTITTSNIVANSGENLLISSNLEVGTSNLFVDTTTGNVGIGTTTSNYKLHVAGDIYATGNITGYSDKRAKSDIQKIENALEKIEKLNGYTFTMNNKRYTGLVAQEVLPVLPEAVVGTEETEYAIAYGNMMGLIVEGIKEIKKKLDM